MKSGKMHKHNHHSTENSKEKKNKDRLSDLSDCVLLQILSFLNTKEAVHTCILSTRWKILWKHIPTLRLCSSSFRTAGSSSNLMAIQRVTKFISQILSLREASTSLLTVDLHLSEISDLCLFKMIIKYVVSHNVQRLHMYLAGNFRQFQPCLFSCHTLMFLNLYADRSVNTCFPNSLSLPALTYLSLHSFTFCVGDDGRAEPFSALSKLNILFIDQCEILNEENLFISSTTLVNLTIIMHMRPYYASKPNFGIELYVPSLCNFAFSGIPLQKLCGNKNNLSTIKHVNVHVHLRSYPTNTSPFVLLNWLVELANMKSLTVTSSTLQVLSLVPDLLKVELPSLCNLKSLIVRNDLYAPILKGIVDFLKRNSPSVTVDIIDQLRYGC